MKLQASCHCGAVRFEAPTPEKIIRCNCTYCDRVGALWAYCPPDAFSLLSDAATLLTYAPKTVEHYSCATCGMVTHGRSPDFKKQGPDIMSYNIRMAVDFDRSAVAVVDLDGRHQW